VGRLERHFVQTSSESAHLVGIRFTLCTRATHVWDFIAALSPSLCFYNPHTVDLANAFESDFVIGADSQDNRDHPVFCLLTTAAAQNILCLRL
jgi:hypothetical protein